MRPSTIAPNVLSDCLPLFPCTGCRIIAINAPSRSVCRDLAFGFALESKTQLACRLLPSSSLHKSTNTVTQRSFSPGIPGKVSRIRLHCTSISDTFNVSVERMTESPLSLVSGSNSDASKKSSANKTPVLVSYALWPVTFINAFFVRGPRLKPWPKPA